MPQRLLNKVAVVTGAESGLGRAIAERFAADGAKVVVVGQRRELLEDVVQRAPARILPIVADLTRPADLEQLAAGTVRRFGRGDVLVLAAETVRSTAFAESTPEAVQELFAANFVSPQQTVRVLLPHLSRGASVVFMTGELADGSLTGAGIYNASKGAVRALARALAAELSPRGIRVNCLAPGAVRMISSAEPPSAPAALEELAEAAVFLASDASRGLTGQELVIDMRQGPLQ